MAGRVGLRYNKWNTPYIYHIIVGNDIYIGQSTTQSPLRIAQHFRAAYYREVGEGATDSERKIHDKMQQVRVQNVKVIIYDDVNFGIANFDQIINAFLQEWEPIPAQDATQIRLDLAEIFHIQWAKNNTGFNVTNNQMGGSISGYAVRGTLKDVQEQNRKKKKVLLKNDSPDIATTLFTAPADDLASINDAMRYLFDVAFSDEWREYCQRIDIKLNADSQQTWKEFFENQIMPELTLLFTKQLKNDLYSKLQKTRNITSSDLHKHMRNFIKKGFIEPREKALRQVLKKIAPTQSWSFNLDMIMEGLDWFRLSDYISSAVSRPITAIFSDKQLKSGATKGEVQRENLRNFKPANFLAMYKFNKLSQTTERGQWISQLKVTGGRTIEDWQKNFSLLMFNRFFNIAERDRPFSSFVNNVTYPLTETENDRENVIKMYQISHSDWLSTRIHDVYRKYAPGYSGAWWAFYRPMVALWRFLYKAPPFYMSSEDSSSSYQYWLGDEAIIKYKMGETAVFEASEELYIY